MGVLDAADSLTSLLWLVHRLIKGDPSCAAVVEWLEGVDGAIADLECAIANRVLGGQVDQESEGVAALVDCIEDKPDLTEYIEENEPSSGEAEELDVDDEGAVAGPLDEGAEDVDDEVKVTPRVDDDDDEFDPDEILIPKGEGETEVILPENCRPCSLAMARMLQFWIDEIVGRLQELINLCMKTNGNLDAKVVFPTVRELRYPFYR